MRKILYYRILKGKVKEQYISIVLKSCSLTYTHIYIYIYISIYMVNITFSILFFSWKKNLKNLTIIGHLGGKRKNPLTQHYNYKLSFAFYILNSHNSSSLVSKHKNTKNIPVGKKLISTVFLISFPCASARLHTFQALTNFHPKIPKSKSIR